MKRDYEYVDKKTAMHLVRHGFRKAAFTLAEVLITLAVIGIVAAITIPTLVNNYNVRVTVTALTKDYALFNEAFKLAFIDKGTLTDWGFKTLLATTDEDGNFTYNNSTNIDTSKILLDNISPYLKIAKTCAPQDNSCIEVKEDSGLAVYSAVLENGTSFYFVPQRTDRVDLTVDVDGLKGKNQWGVDMFKFGVNSDGVTLKGNRNDTFSFEEYCNASANYGACSAWVIYNGNMDYLKCPDELSWDGKHKCSD